MTIISLYNYSTVKTQLNIIIVIVSTLSMDIPPHLSLNAEGCNKFQSQPLFNDPILNWEGQYYDIGQGDQSDDKWRALWQCPQGDS